MPAVTPPAIVLGGHITGLAVLRALGRHGVPAYVAGRRTALVRSSRWFRPAPGRAPEETPDGERLAAYLRSLPCERAVLFPCTDDWTLAAASLPEDLAARFPAPVPPADVVRALTDKERFAAVAERFGVPIPRTLTVRSAEDIDGVSDGELSRFFLKPRDSQDFNARYGRKGLPLTSRGEAATHVRRLTAEGVEMVLQEFIPGPATGHVFLDGYVGRDGAVRAWLARRRLRMYPADLGNSTLSVTIPAAEAEPAVADLRRLFAGISFTGLFDAEFTYDARDGQLKAIEINPRPWWQFEIAEASGLPLALIAYRDALGLPVPEVAGYRVGRIWVLPQLDVRAWWAQRSAGPPTGPSPVRAWFGGANALFSWDDPMPATEEAGRLARRAIARARSRARTARGGGADGARSRRALRPRRSSALGRAPRRG
jgi:D-aspartate ligase